MAAASRRGFNEALSIAYYAGTYTGMLTDGLGLLGGTLYLHRFRQSRRPMPSWALVLAARCDVPFMRWLGRRHLHQSRRTAGR